MQPQYVEMPELKVVGLGANFISVLSPNRNNARIIPPLWHQFMQRFGEIDRKVGQASYGLCEPLPESSPRTDPAEMYYVACTQVADFERIPDGMVKRLLPAGRYAKFIHKGKLDTLGETLRFIYQTWLPSGTVKLRNAPHMEVYDERFILDSDASELDICVPIV